MASPCAEGHYEWHVKRNTLRGFLRSVFELGQFTFLPSSLVTQSLNCPTCGAAAAGSDATRCDYCGSTLTYAACPACFGPMFVGMEFCPRCGAKGARVVEGGSNLPCPSCKTPLNVTTIGSTSLSECGSCAGTWLASATFTDLCTSREERGAVVAQYSARTNTVTRVPAATRVTYLPCPSCAKLMNRQNFGQRSGVIVDVCKTHGVWLQQGELHAVLAFIDSGGLEHAREFERQRNAEEARYRAAASSGPRDSSGSMLRASFTSSDDAHGEGMLIKALRSLLS